MKNDSRTSGASGLSVLEVLAVLCLLSGIWLAAESCFADTISRDLVRRTGRSLAAFLEHTALQAMIVRRDVALSLDGEERTLRVSGMFAEADGMYRLPAGLTFRGSHIPRLRGAAAEIELRADGSSSAATLRVSGVRGGEECLIVQSLGGRRLLRCFGAS